MNTRPYPYGPKVVNKNSFINYDITGSLVGIEEPSKTITTFTKKNYNKTKITNNRVLNIESNKNVLRYSAKEIQKQITSFNSELNEIYINNSYIDDSVEITSKDYFEVYYNGMRAPDKFTVFQSGSTVVLKFTEDYIRYETLQMSEIFVIGKFTE